MIRDAQTRLRAATETGSNLVVTAGAGTGKTSLLVERILQRVLGCGTRMERLAAITFTNKAASELRERIEDALEEVVEQGGRPPPPDQGSSEATRVLARLAGSGGPDPALLVERALAALEELPRAAVATIHAFAGEILRRHAGRADVDVGYAVDTQGAGRRLFEELWRDLLTEELGGEAVPGPWRKVLGILPLADIRKLTERLSSYAIPIEVDAAHAMESQREVARRCAQEVRDQVVKIKALVDGAHGLNHNLPAMFDAMLLQLGRIADGCELPQSLEEIDLKKSVTLGKRADVQHAKEIESRLQACLATTRALLASDPSLAEAVLALLDPFRARYRRRLHEEGLLTFDALLVLAAKLLREDAAVRREEAARFDHILVDEFQDTDPAQYELLFCLSAAGGGDGPIDDPFALALAPGRLFIVGDAKQSIYRFRGADIRAYERALKVLEESGAEVLALTTNFRSIPDLVEPLNALFDPLFRRAREASGGGAGLDPPHEPLGAHRGPGRRPAIDVLSVGRPKMAAKARRSLEGIAVARRVVELLESREARAREIAILLRARTAIESYLLALRRAGVPYVVEGGKGFYRRYEVEILLSALIAITHPGDGAALVSLLRSPLCGVPDTELWLHARGAGAVGPRRPRPWTLHAEVDAARCPTLAAAMSMVRGIAERHAGASLDTLARALLDETPLRQAVAALHDGAQGVLNLEKAARRIAALCEDGTLTRAEVLARIDEEDEDDLAAGDSPIADESVDAVRVLTIHSAKGLEWPVVILPDLHEKTGGRRSTAASSVRLPGLAPALALKVGERWTPGEALRAREDKLQEEAEDRRLLYVAATRARDRLIFVVGGSSGASAWRDALDAWGYRVDDAFPQAGPLHGGAILHSLVEWPARLARSGTDGGDVAALVAASRRWSALKEELERLPDSRAASPSAARSSPTDPEETDRDASRVGPTEEGCAVLPREIARAAGVAFHLLIESRTDGDSRWCDDNVGRAAAVAARRTGAPADAVEARLRELLARARRSGALERIAKEASLGREVPVLFAEADGRTWEGSIDCVTGSPEAPSIVDYKTSAAATDEEHAGQLSRYMQAVGRALGLASPPPARVEPL